METFQKVELVKRPLKKGERYLVPCVVKVIGGKLHITPIINHPHSDKENGQDYVHYHADTRFVEFVGSGFAIKQKHSKHVFLSKNRIKLSDVSHDDKTVIRYYELPVINETERMMTTPELIRKSKLKHNCIHKGKCPHRGYDLSQVEPIDGVITCPLHGLKFDANTKVKLN